MAPWHESDEFWRLLMPMLLDASALEAAAAEARDAAALLRLRAGARVLDMGCGPGRHSIELAALGYGVTGVDRTALYLDTARQRAAERGVTAEFVRASMLEFRRPGAFDGAVNLLTSFGYFEDRAEDLLAMRNLCESLAPGGAAVVDTFGKEIVARVFAPRHWQEFPGGTLWLQEREVVPGWATMRNRWIWLAGGERREFTFEHRLFSAVELSDLMLRAGFSTAEVYGGLDGRPYDRESMRLVVVGRR